MGSHLGILLPARVRRRFKFFKDWKTGLFFVVREHLLQKRMFSFSFLGVKNWVLMRFTEPSTMITTMPEGGVPFGAKEINDVLV